jgi:beta-lactamase class A
MAGMKRVCAVLITAAALAACTSSHPSTGRSTPDGSPSAGAGSTADGAPVADTSTPAPPPPDPRQVATRALSRLAHRLPHGAVSVAVRDERTGAEYAYHASRRMWTGSVYKLLVLETLLLQRQDSGGWFTSAELTEITAMIEQSENVAGYQMFLDAGGSGALEAAARRLGMRHTAIGVSDPTFTTMSARDGLALLGCLVGDGPLEPRSQAFVLHLMRSVQADQRWGVGVVADPGTRFANKNGWLNVDDTNGPGETDGGLWVADSLGIVRFHGDQLLVAVLTRHNPDFATGVELVQRVAKIVAPAVLTNPR